MKSTLIAAALAVVTLNFPAMAHADDLATKWAGTYSSKETNFVTLKRLTLAKEKDGSIKIHGALVGFPDEVPIGEATAEPYADRSNKANPDTLLASFSSEKYKPFMMLTSGQWDGTHIRIIAFHCYMKDVDGTKVHFTGQLIREP
jgi:hypothetical protein